jgi:hypothetical protein
MGTQAVAASCWITITLQSSIVNRLKSAFL